MSVPTLRANKMLITNFVKIKSEQSTHPCFITDATQPKNPIKDSINHTSYMGKYSHL